VHQEVPPPVPTPESADQTPELQMADLEQQQEQILTDAGTPEFRPLPWRVADRNRIKSLLARMLQFMGADGTVAFTEAGDGAMKFDDAQLAQLDAVNDLYARIDDTFEQLAVDPREYAKWSAELQNPELVLSALLGKYGRAVGESLRSPSA
jgi:hypothetical protein